MSFIHEHTRHDMGETVRIFEGVGTVRGGLLIEVEIKMHPVVKATLDKIAAGEYGAKRVVEKVTEDFRAIPLVQSALHSLAHYDFVERRYK